MKSDSLNPFPSKICGLEPRSLAEIVRMKLTFILTRLYKNGLVVCIPASNNTAILGLDKENPPKIQPSPKVRDIWAPSFKT